MITDFDAHTDPLYKHLKVLKLEGNVKIQNSPFVHDYLNNMLPDCFQNYFSPLSDLQDIKTKL